MRKIRRGKMETEIHVRAVLGVRGVDYKLHEKYMELYDVLRFFFFIKLPYQSGESCVFHGIG